MVLRLKSIYHSISKSNIINNSLWGLSGRIIETLFLMLFFVILSRRFVTNDFALYLLANNIYQLVVGFSSMGLGSWFIREHTYEQQKNEFFNKFLKVQIWFGLIFYLINICLIFILYQDVNLKLICIVLGLNIIFDNVIYALRSLNIAQSQQKRTAIIMAIDGLFKLTTSCLLLFYPFSVLILSTFLVAIRLFTVTLFIQIGSSIKINLMSLYHLKISWSYVREYIFSNWRFFVIMGLSITFWRSATIIISKFLTLKDVANYEIAYKIFSAFMILPFVASASIYPHFVKYYADDDHEAIKHLYKKMFVGFTIFCIMSYAFIQSFARVLIPIIFGNNYLQAINCLQEMFLTFLVFPTAFLQANLLIAIKLEKIDMFFNMIALIVNFTGCFIGLYFYKSLSVINYSIFFAFFLFHFSQNILLLKLKFTSMKYMIFFYSILILFILIYKSKFGVTNTIFVFISLFCIVAGLLSYCFFKNYKSRFFTFKTQSV